MHFTPPNYGYGKVLPGQTVSHRFTRDNATRRHSQARATGTGTQPGHIYWANPIAGSIGVANLDGSDPHTIIRGLGSGSPEGLAVSKAHIYWVNDGSIEVANLDGSDPHTVITGLTSPYGLAAGCAHIYWTDFGDVNMGEAPAVWDANLNGSDPRAITPANTPVGVAAGSTHLYWVSPDSIVEAGLDGSDPHVIVTDQNAPSEMAVAGTHVYWTDGIHRSIREANLDGTDPHTIITGQDAYWVAVSAP